METKGIVVGAILCVLGFVVFIYGLINMTRATALSDSFLVVVGMFLGIAGFIVLATNAFSGGSFFS